MKKIAIGIASLLLCIGMLAGCGNSAGSSEDAAGVKMYLTISSADTFRQTIIDAADKCAKDAGAELTVKDAEGSLESQLAHIKEAVDGGYDVILCLSLIHIWNRWLPLG